MKNIELTEEHSFKLLKMCKELFPEIKSIVLQENLGTLTFDQLQQIHWFEFCMTHLCDKIFIHDESLNEFLLTFNVDKHPIDYLYEEFKKLK